MEKKPSTFRLKISLTLKVQIASQRIRRTQARELLTDLHVPQSYLTSFMMFIL